ncbi:hypothetical protein V1478_014174 [Vespula squamosa]|uniref:Uncharacterized protein n=1 Tax=Vespula squamosa TaxID=30214 RepID=A0ABD2A7B0_VESSQ
MNPSRFLHPFPLYPSSRSLDVGGSGGGGAVGAGAGAGGDDSGGGGGSYDTAGGSNILVVVTRRLRVGDVTLTLTPAGTFEDAAFAWLDDLSFSPHTLCERPLESSVTIASV